MGTTNAYDGEGGHNHHLLAIFPSIRPQFNFMPGFVQANP